MNQIRPGDFGWVMHHENWVSRAIAWFMRSRWSHSFLVLEVTAERVYLLETSDFHVTIGTLDRYLTDPHCEIEIWSPNGIDPVARTQGCEVARTHYGTVYGYGQLFSFGVRALLKRVGIRVPNFIRWGMVCTAVPMIAAREMIPGLSHVDPESIETQEWYVLALPYCSPILAKLPKNP